MNLKLDADNLVYLDTIEDVIQSLQQGSGWTINHMGKLPSTSTLNVGSITMYSGDYPFIDLRINSVNTVKESFTFGSILAVIREDINVPAFVLS